MRILITGHKGLIGTHLFNKLSEEHEVMGVDIKEGKNINNLHEIFPTKTSFDMIIHCAAMCRIRETIKNPEKAFNENALGTLNVFEFARKNNIKKVIFFSSSRKLAKERNIYTATKIFGEELAKAYYDSYGIQYKIIRPSTVFGEYDALDRIVPKFISNALKNEPLHIFGDQSKTLDITYIDDFIRAYDLIMSKGAWNTSYNVGNGAAVNVNEMAEYIVKKTNSKSNVVFYPPEIAQPQQVCIDNSKIKQLGFTPAENWKHGIDKTINWVMQE